METALDLLLPRMVPQSTFALHPFQGKQDMLKKLPARFGGYARRHQPEQRIVVLCDRDQQDCRELKDRIVAMSDAAGVSALVRIAIEELEAWLLGDVPALRRAYPKVPASLAEKAAFRDPDAVSGGTAEALGRVLHTAGYYGDRLPKVEVARRVAEGMDPGVNRSHSFCVFRDGLRALH